jgi:hypothetical protein
MNVPFCAFTTVTKLSVIAQAVINKTLSNQKCGRAERHVCIAGINLYLLRWLIELDRPEVASFTSEHVLTGLLMAGAGRL